MKNKLRKERRIARQNDRRKNRANRLRTSSTAIKLFATLLIVGLAAADVFAIRELFSKLDTNPTQQWVYSLTMSVCLEGLPTFLGICCTTLFDHTNYKKNDLWNARIGAAVSFIGLLLAFTMVILLRLSLIKSYGGAEAFANGTYAANTTENYQPGLNSGYLKDQFLCWCPIVTSVMAFVASWVAFPSNSQTKLEKELDDMHTDYVELEGEFLVARNVLELAKEGLWKDLAPSDTTMPRATNTFRKECYVRIQNLLFHNCMMKYPSQIERYNQAIQIELQNMLEDMADHTTIGDEISNLDLQKILCDFDNKMSKPINCWGSEAAEKALMDDLKQQLSNAIVVAQFRSTTEPGL